MNHWKDYLCYRQHLVLSFSSLPIDSEKNDRWRKWRKNIWNVGKVPRWGKIGTHATIFTGTNKIIKILWNGEKMFILQCQFVSFFPLDLLVSLAYSKRNYVLMKRGIVLFLGFFGAPSIRQLLMRSYTLVTRKWTQPTSVHESQNKVLNLFAEMCEDGFGSLYCGWMEKKVVRKKDNIYVP